MIILTIDGRELRGLEIFKYTPKWELLDGEGTGRTRAVGWDLIRDPQGVICNFAVEIFKTRADNPDYIYFMDKYYSLGSQEFVSVSHVDHTGRSWTQEMYYVVDPVECIKFDDGIIYTGNITARFIAKKGRIQ